MAAGEGESGFHSAYADKDGHFEIHGLRPGRYLIGVGIDAKPGTTEWKNRVYYPGVREKNLAIVIEIGPAGKRTDVEFPLSVR
jgi:hypothetical protein